MKAILVLDNMPIGCCDCRLHIGIEDFAGMDAGCYCFATGSTNYSREGRDARCPLIEWPDGTDEYLLGGDEDAD